MDGADVLEQAAAWLRQGRRAVLATVVATWDASPWPVGALLAIDEQATVIGAGAGAGLDGALAQEAREVLREGEPRLVSLILADETAWAAGLPCGGRVQVYVEILA